MSSENYNLRWEAYKNNLSNGFTKLQQMQEFIDVTLATGGHLVGAHKSVLALASPYFKEMLKSAPSHHPIIFLGPINHTVLAFILEYIYTGEVNIPSCVLPAFIDASKMLHIAGIKDIDVPQKLTNSDSNNPAKVKTEWNKNTRITNIPRQPNCDTKQINEQPTVIEENNQVQINDTPAGMPFESSIQHNDSSLSTVAHVTIDQENRVIVQPLAKEIQSSEYVQIDQNIPIILEEIYNARMKDNELPNCAEMNEYNNNENPTGNTQTVDNNDEDSVDSTSENDKHDEIINPDEESLMQTDFENLIQGKFVPIDLGSGSRKGEVNVDIKSDSGILTISHITHANATENNANGENSESCNETLQSINVPSALYFLTGRGSLEMILDRFIYNMYFTTVNNKRRWRCIDYRKNKCSVYVDTLKEDIFPSNKEHHHSNHEFKIKKIIRNKQLYSSVEQAYQIMMTKKRR